MLLTHGNVVKADAEALVNTVNCVGVMGKGVALQFKQAFPDNMKEYGKACKKKQVQPGRMLTFATSRLGNPKYIINFPTKRHWKGKSRLDDIESGLRALVEEVRRLEIKSIAIPPLGCGSGGLDWTTVRAMIEGAFTELPDVEMLLFEPAGAPEVDVMPVATAHASMTRARAMLVKLLEQYAIPGYRLTLLEIQKLAYFLQVTGEPLRLNFTKQKYGPYAEKLNFVLQRIEGHYIRGYGDRSRKAMVTLMPGAVELAVQFLAADEPQAQARLDRLGRLIEGFETPYGMELLSSVHWVAANEDACNVSEAIDRVLAWNARKRRTFSPEHVRKAWQRLEEQKWLVSASAQGPSGAPRPT